MSRVISPLLMMAALWCASYTTVIAETLDPDLILEDNPAATSPSPQPEPDYGMEAVQIYKQDELIALINENTHLDRVVVDECQLVEDIEARAEKVKIPAYQFLWGDMLAWGICVPRDVELGVHYMWQSAEQGLAAALEQLGRYYYRGILVQTDLEKAVVLLKESASLGFVKAQLQLVELLIQGAGSPHDYEDAYRWLHHAIIADRSQHRQASLLLAQLAKRMPPRIVERAKSSLHPY